MSTVQRTISVFLAGCGLILVLGAHACGTLSGARVQCELDAVHQLPLDNPDELSIGDTLALAARLKQCVPKGDAGS